MKIKPIPFNADMTKAIWEGRKTVTRRPVKGYALEHPEVDVDGSVIGVYQQDEGTVFPAVIFAPYQPGEIVYVPETWRLLEMWESPTRRRTGVKVELRNGEVVQFHFYDQERAAKWRKYLDKPKDHWQSPYFMPREAARLFLRVTSVRAERLQDIDGPAAEAEGALVVRNPVIRYDKAIYDKFGKKEFKPIWDSTIRPKDRDLYGWAANPWVWVIKFERISKEEAEKS